MRMRSSKRALEDSQRFAAMFPGLTAVLADLAQVESIEQTADAAEQRLAAATQATIDKQAELAALGATFDKTKLDMTGHVEGKRQEGEDLFATKQVEAGKIIEAAQVKAAAIVADAQTSVDAVQADARSKIDALNAQMLQQQNALSATSARLATITASLAAAQAQLDDVNAQKQALLAKLG